MKLLYLFIIGIIVVFFTSVSLVFGQEQKSDIEKKIEEYKNKLVELRSQKNTLASQIQYMDTQVYLTALQIEETEEKIEKTQNEIETLTTKIEGLDDSLSYLSKLLINQVIEGYKKRSVSFFDLFLDSGNAQDLFNRLQYLKTTQNNNQKTLIQVQKTKLNFEDLKKLREENKIKLSELSNVLEQQKNSLAIQRNAKQKLLADTQNNETIYQKLLTQAEQQLRAFKSFVQGSGVGIISNNQLGSGSDGAYYSQRDERWANKAIGYSSENVLDVGCLLTSISMFAKKTGSNITPLDIASDANRFYGSTALMSLPWSGVSGKGYVGLSIGDIDGELEKGNPVIVGVMINNCSWGGNHFILLIKKDGSDYIMHDPVYGPDLKFSSHYGTICSAATFR